MKKDIITEEYTAGDNITVIDKNSPYNSKAGTIARLGSAGEVIYIHARLDGVNTIITFRTFQVRKTE